MSNYREESLEKTIKTIKKYCDGLGIHSKYGIEKNHSTELNLDVLDRNNDNIYLEFLEEDMRKGDYTYWNMFGNDWPEIWEILLKYDDEPYMIEIYGYSVDGYLRVLVWKNDNEIISDTLIDSEGGITNCGKYWIKTPYYGWNEIGIYKFLVESKI